MVSDLEQVLLPEGGIAGPLPTELTEQRLLGLFRNMVLLRTFDRRALNLQRQGRIHFYAPCMGQEAAVIGSSAALEPSDWMFPTYREAGACYQRGMSLQTICDQLFGNGRDLVQGRQMPNHFADHRLRIVSISSPVGTQMPQAAGLAMSQTINGEADATICYMGDGATSEGDFHAGLNFAGVFKAPVVFFCQNNQWAITVPLKSQTASESIAIKAKAYGFEGVRVDGNDVLAVYTAVRAALAKARCGGGPTLIEALTYRMGAHSTSDDPRRYRDDGVVEPWRDRDPLERIESYLRERGWLDDDGLKTMQAEIDQEIEDAIVSAEAQPPPEPESLFEDILAQPTARLLEQRAELLRHLETGLVRRLVEGA